ncbi:MAG: hypothetical protein ACE147_19025, partial [Candidatus Methylomirabilales bacterium]
MTAPVSATPLGVLLPALRPAAAAKPDGWLGLSATAFGEAVLEALAESAKAQGRGGAEAHPARAECRVPSSDLEPRTSNLEPEGTASLRRPGLPAAEMDVIGREAARTGVDPALLVALRRTENGPPGREFGVLSVPAHGLKAQARIAANSIRNSIARFRAAGGDAVEAERGGYTRDFLRFFSARYAPVGADNDRQGLNRAHAANLIALSRL